MEARGEREFVIAILDTARKTSLHRREPLLSRLRDAFLDVGYEQMTMLALAPRAGVSRRTLYNHFANKEDAFRFLLRCDGDVAIEQAMAAARAQLAAGADPVDIFVVLMDVRYADNRRRLAQSKHALEINEKAFRLARDIMVEHATTFQREVAGLIADMQAADLLALKPGTGPVDLAQMLCDGARGSNQTLPPIPIEQLPARYRRLIDAILHGALA